MEEIQFFNYIMSILGLLLAAAAFWTVWKNEDRRDEEIKDLRERINTAARTNDNNNNNNKKR